MNNILSYGKIIGLIFFIQVFTSSIFNPDHEKGVDIPIEKQKRICVSEILLKNGIKVLDSSNLTSPAYCFDLLKEEFKIDFYNDFDYAYYLKICPFYGDTNDFCLVNVNYYRSDSIAIYYKQLLDSIYKLKPPEISDELRSIIHIWKYHFVNIDNSLIYFHDENRDTSCALLKYVFKEYENN